MSDHPATPVHGSAKDRWVDTDATGDHDDLSGPQGSSDHGETHGHGIRRTVGENASVPSMSPPGAWACWA